MNKLLDEIKISMHKSSYSIEDIKIVTDAFNHFFDYLSRNHLTEQFEPKIKLFRNNIFRRIKEGNSATNIASVAMFNGTSFVSTFMRECIESKVQDVLKGFLRSSEVYYNMACNSEGLDVARILAQLSLDGIDNDKSIELTAPTTIISFSTELSLKTLYSIKNYDAIVRNIYSEVTRCVNGSYPNENLLNDSVRLVEQVSGDWKNIGLSADAQQTINDVRDSYTDNDRPVNLLDNDRFGNVKVNGHTLYKIFDNLPEEYRNMIKYQIATAFSRGDKKNLDQKVVSAIDYFLMISKLDTTLENIDSTKQMVVNSNNFDRMRYLINQMGSEELLFSMAYATASYIVAKSEVEGRSFSTLKNSSYTSKGLQYTEELDKLVNNNDENKYLLDYITNNRQLLSVVKNLSSKDLYVLIDMFSLDEINWMKDSCNMANSCSFKEMLYYCIFFKKYLNDYEFRYSGEKYTNINRLFYTIKNTNNLAMLGSQISQWFTEINIYSLSQEEFEALRIFDNEYIYNSLSYKDRVLYKKCSDRGVPFKIYYTSGAYSSIIADYMDGPEFVTDDFDNQVSYRVNRDFNRLFVIDDDKYNSLKQNSEIYDSLIQEFGSITDIPSFLVSLPLGDIKVIIDYCKRNNQSIKEWSQELLTSQCFFCRSKYIINKVKDCYEHVTVRVHVPQKSPRIKETLCLVRPDFDGLDIIPFNINPFIDFKSKRNYVSDSDTFLYSIYRGATLTIDLKKEKETNKDLMDYLLANGFDYLSASYLQKNASREQIDALIGYASKMALPREVLSYVVSNRIRLDELITKNTLFVSHGCRLDDIPIYYYTANDISTDVFEKLFNILNGIYRKNNIPAILLSKETDKVQNLINKLRESNINIYDFISYLSKYSTRVLDKVDSYIYVYSQIKQNPISGGMIIKTFDNVVNDYYFSKDILNYIDDNPVLLKASLYQDLTGILSIIKLCNLNGKEFYPELLYFEKSFLTQYFETAYMCVFAYRMSQRELVYQDAYNVMESAGWYQKQYNEEINKSKGVA